MLLQLLPDDVLVNILCFLSTTEVLTISTVCKKLCKLSKHDLVWKYLFFREWHFFPGIIGKEFFKKYLELEDKWQNGNCAVFKLSNVGQPLKSVHIIGQRNLENDENETTVCVQNSTHVHILSWENGETIRKKSFPALRGSMDCNNEVIAILSFNNKREYSLEIIQIQGNDFTKKITKLPSSNQPLITCTSLGRNSSSLACSITNDIYYYKDMDYDPEKIPGTRQYTIYDLQVGRKLLMQASNNSKIQLFDLRTLQNVANLSGHKYSVNCARFHQIDLDDGNYIVSGSADKLIKCWDMRTMKEVFSKSHDDSVLCVEFDSRKIVSGAFNGKISQWSMETGSMLNVYDCENGLVSKLGSEKEYQYFVSSSSQTVHGMIYSSMPVVESLKFKNSLLVAACSDGNIRRWYFDKKE